MAVFDTSVPSLRSGTDEVSMPTGRARLLGQKLRDLELWGLRALGLFGLWAFRAFQALLVLVQREIIFIICFLYVISNRLLRELPCHPPIVSTVYWILIFNLRLSGYHPISRHDFWESSLGSIHKVSTRRGGGGVKEMTESCVRQYWCLWNHNPPTGGGLCWLRFSDLAVNENEFARFREFEALQCIP